MNPSRYVSPIFPTFPTFPSFPSFHISLLAPLLKNLFGPPISSCTETNKQNKTKQNKKKDKRVYDGSHQYKFQRDSAATLDLFTLD